MAEKEVAVVRYPDHESTRPSNPLSSIISKFTEIVNFRFPPPPAKKNASKAETERKTAGNTVYRGGEVVEESKPVTVKLFDAHPTTVAPLKLEAEEVKKVNSPVFLWQVCAIGGFFVLRWVLARWNERREKKKSDEDSPTQPQPVVSTDGDE